MKKVRGIDLTDGTDLSGATVAASKNIALEMAPKVRCNVVLPGPVSTEMWNSHTDDVEGMMKEYAKSCLTPTVADPTDTAEAYLYWFVRHANP